MRTIQYSTPTRTLIFILCSLSLLMMTAGKCKKKTTTPTNNTTYFTVKFNSNGGSAVDSVRLTSGSKVAKPGDPTRVDYTFGGWYSDAGLTQTFDFNTPITKDITIYAKWNVNPGKISYNVTFNTNGGSAIVMQQVISGEKATKPLDPTRAKSIFLGWYSDEALTQTFDFNTPITKDMTLYAKWELGYKVAFNSNGGSIVDTQSVLSGGKATKPNDPTRTNYGFVGWYSDVALTQTFDFNTAIMKDTTLYAKWIRQYTVTFETNNGNTINPIKVNEGSKLNKPAEPIRANYIFQGWYKDASLTTIFDFVTETINADITIYAKWIPPDISGVIELGAVPSDLRIYDEVSQSVLQYYRAGLNVVPIYVTKGGSGDGRSWTSALNSVKTALDAITYSQDTLYLVLVGAGVYNTGSTMRLKNNVAIVGGWPSTGGWTRNTSNITELSGGGSIRIFYNTYTQGNPLTNSAVLYCLKVANAITNDYGSAMYNEYASPAIMRVIFANNIGLYGAAIYNKNSSPIITNATFSNNSASTSGGGIYNDQSSPIVTNVTFSSNNANVGSGGGMYNDNSSSPVVTNTTFVNNTAKNFGGGMRNNNNSSAVVTNAIFWGNSASTDSQYTIAGTSIYNSVVQNYGTTLKGNSSTNPAIGVLTYGYGGYVTVIPFTGVSPIDIGFYVKQSKRPNSTNTYTFYYSTNGTVWYTDQALTIVATPPSDAINLTATDATGYIRSGRPDAGAWEHR